MNVDAVTLLDKLSESLLEFAEKFDVQRHSDVKYGPYIKDLFIHTAQNYTLLKPFARNVPSIPYRSLYVFLPGNVPMVFFEVLPISVIFNIKTFFKYPRTEKTLYDTFIRYIIEKNPVYTSLFKGEYLNHHQATKKIEEFDFIFFFGSEKLIPLLGQTGKPFRFFGPGFSIGVAFSNIHESFVNDVLYFDQEGCLSMKFLFYTNPEIQKRVIEVFRNLSSLIPPTGKFSKDGFLYKLLYISEYGKILYRSNTSAVVEIYEDTLKDFPLPQRTLILKRIQKEEDITHFLGNKITLIQAVATDKKEKLKVISKKASFITNFGRLQYQPYNFFFKKDVNLLNIFREDNHDYKMAENL